jgi:hypothetical protein
MRPEPGTLACYLSASTYWPATMWPAASDESARAQAVQNGSLHVVLR